MLAIINLGIEISIKLRKSTSSRPARNVNHKKVFEFSPKLIIFFSLGQENLISKYKKVSSKSELINKSLKRYAY